MHCIQVRNVVVELVAVNHLDDSNVVRRQLTVFAGRFEFPIR
jgi:hypothetical protein